MNTTSNDQMSASLPNAARFALRFLAIVLIANSLATADDKSRETLTEALSRFNAPEVPAELKQKLRDYVSSDLKQRRDAANAKSTVDWEQIKTRAEWERFRKAKVKRLRESLGLSFQGDNWQPPNLPERVEVAGVIKGEGYRIDRLIYKSRFGVWITANLYVPEPARAKMPGFIISHAHHTPKEQGELQDMGVLWARAGCYVLVPDHLGHGERREHPFKSKDDYDKPFQVSRQDYYHRYDLNLQLNIVDESLMGCLALDLMSGVSLLHELPGIDREKIILLGAVAGGGDPAGVTAAIDERITCAAPFNFGGPQPESRYPLPDDVETSFNYGGSGGWESTRNLAHSYSDGTLPWVIVGSIAPRRLIYGHEFAWDREHDPVWKRFDKIYGWYDKVEHLSFATGYGTITAKNPEGSHCTHIGKTHRKQIHEALPRWFDIRLPQGEESTDRHDAGELRCWTDELRAKLKPVPLLVWLQTRWLHPAKVKGRGELLDGRLAPTRWQSEAMAFGASKATQFVLERRNKQPVPLLLLEPSGTAAKQKPGVLIITRAGKQEFVRQRADMIAELLDAGVSVALPDLYSSGLTGTGDDLGRRSSNTSRSSTLAMFGRRLSDEQMADASAAILWLTDTQKWDNKTLALWSDSLIPPNSADTNYQIPRDDDSRLPRGPDPLPQQVALLLAHELEVAAVYTRGGIDSLSSALSHQLVLLPHDSAPLPDSYRAPGWVPSKISLRQDQVVDCWNRELLATAPTDRDPKTATKWILARLKIEKK